MNPALSIAFRLRLVLPLLTLAPAYSTAETGDSLYMVIEKLDIKTGNSEQEEDFLPRELFNTEFPTFYEDVQT